MSLNLDQCAIPKVWCGKHTPPKRRPGDLKYYYKTGSRSECVKIGYGAGMYGERKKHLPTGSLQQIPYVGDVYEKKFKKMGITNKHDLRREATTRSSKELGGLLKRVFTKKGGVLDKRAYNSTVVYLYQNGIGNVPQCSKIKV